jgi:hypothetical protein
LAAFVILPLVSASFVDTVNAEAIFAVPAASSGRE